MGITSFGGAIRILLQDFGQKTLKVLLRNVTITRSGATYGAALQIDGSPPPFFDLRLPLNQLLRRRMSLKRCDRFKDTVFQMIWRRNNVLGLSAPSKHLVVLKRVAVNKNAASLRGAVHVIQQDIILRNFRLAPVHDFRITSALWLKAWVLECKNIAVCVIGRKRLTATRKSAATTS